MMHGPFLREHRCIIPRHIFVSDHLQTLTHPANFVRMHCSMCDPDRNTCVDAFRHRRFQLAEFAADILRRI